LSSLLKAASAIVQQQMPLYLQECNDYRKTENNKHAQKNLILNDQFWYSVFNNPRLTRKGLIQYMQQHEKNPVLQKFEVEHAAGLDYVYKRLAIVSINPVAKLWFVFFSDFWEENKTMSAIEKMEDSFDPTKHTAICYTPMSREEFLQFIKEKRLESGTCSRLFTSDIINQLYSKIDQLKAEMNGGSRSNNSDKSPSVSSVGGAGITIDVKPKPSN
jgi:hypothetical protein